MSVDELSVLDGSKCILQLRGVRPFLSDKYDITRHKNYRYLSDSNPDYAFNIEKHIKRRLKVNPNEPFEMYEFSEEGEDMPDTAEDETDYTDDDFEVDLEPI